MGLFSPVVKVMRTVFPYDEGWGTVIQQFGKPDTIVDTGLSKDMAESLADELRKDLKRMCR